MKFALTAFVLLASTLTTTLAHADAYDDMVAKTRANHLSEASVLANALAKRLNVSPAEVSFDEGTNEFNVRDLNCYNLHTNFYFAQIVCRPSSDHSAFGKIVLNYSAVDRLLRR